MLLAFQRSQGKIVGPSRRRSYSQISANSGTTVSYLNNDRKYYCNLFFKAVMTETDNNYMHRYVVCHQEVRVNLS